MSIDYRQFTIFPIVERDLWEFYKKAQSAFWVADEIDLFSDLRDWVKLNDDERNFIKHVLAFFSSSDGIVTMNLAERFCNDIPYKEGKFFYQFQIAMENIHNETYSRLIDTYIKDEEEKRRMFDAIEHYPCIKKKGEWAMKWINDTTSSFAERLIAFACVEGIFFSSSFTAIFWLKERGLMPGLTFSNELISKDEGMHFEFAIYLYLKMCRDNYIKPLKEKVIHEIISGAVDVEEMFVNDSTNVEMIGMNARLMVQYVHYIADRMCSALEIDKIYYDNNPFYFMENISIMGKTNFFERKNSEYMIAMDQKNITFSESDDQDF
jgi:ribonucleoside-diphosphate reductase beta chain